MKRVENENMDVMSLRAVGEWFWSETFWLPPNNTWADLERDDSIFLPHANDLLAGFPMAILLFGLRLLWERFVASPIGRYYNLRERPPSAAVPNEVLEKAYRTTRRSAPPHQLTKELSLAVGWEIRQIERWWRRRRTQGKHSEMQRFRETSWRLLFYFMSFWCGLYVLHDKPWFYDTHHFWYDYPKQHIPAEIWWYYMIELGFYWSLVMSVSIDIKRKDWTEMMVHHLVTILLIYFSWIDNFVRIGSMVLVIHDAVDWWLEGAKVAKYCKYHKLCDALFVVFTTVWFITRIVIYPLRICWVALTQGQKFLKFYNAYYVFNSLLSVLQVLHVIWFIIIIRLLVTYIVKGQIEKDSRSETEPNSESEDEVVLGKKHVHMNGSGDSPHAHSKDD